MSTAIRSVLDQGLEPDKFEIIVVNDSGKPLPEADWQRSDRIKIIDTNRRNRSIARNVGAAASRGRYLHFLDDDDWMMPGAYETLLNITESSKAGWVYGAFRLTDDSGAIVTEIHPDVTGNCSIQTMAWESLPLQASFILSDAFFAVDGFASLPSLGGGSEDHHLTRQISLFYEMARTEQIVATIRIGDVCSTTNYLTIYDQNRRSREKMIGTPQAFRRLIASAKSSSTRSNYWFGKIIYYYLASIVWNLQNKQFFNATSRGIHMLAGFAMAGPRLLSPDFWRGATQKQYSSIGTAIHKAGADHLFANTRHSIDLASAKRKL